jgi:cardiolipin synthase A/B
MSLRSRRPPRARSEPPRWRRRSVPKEWVYRLAPPIAKRYSNRWLRIWPRLRRFLWSWWPWAVAGAWAIGDERWYLALFFVLMAAATYLVAPIEQSPTLGLDHDFPVDSPEFLPSMVGATGVPFFSGNGLRILNNGDAFYPEMLRAIEEAERSITIEAYIYWAGELGERFARALARQARAGRTVKILLDAVGSATIGTEILTLLAEGGCQVAWFNRIHWYTIGRFNNRTHRKSLIVDGRIAFTGGAGIADQWTGNAQDPDHWRDMQIRLEGPGVLPLQSGFARSWLQTTGELVTGDEYYPTPRAAGDVDLQTILSSPVTGSSAARTMYYLAIVCARRSVWIANPYFVPDGAAITVLIDAARRGVDVKVMVSGIRNDNWLARHNSVRLYGRLLPHGVEIYEYNPTLLHHKTMVVDGLWATVGTTNFDNRSFAHNEENNVCFVDRALVAEMERTFREDLAVCERVEDHAWRRRGLFARAQEFLASYLKEQV